MIEGGFFQSIQHEASAEAGVEEDVQGTVEVVLGEGLAEYGNAFLRAGVQVFRDLDGVGGDDFTVDGGLVTDSNSPNLIGEEPDYLTVVQDFPSSRSISSSISSRRGMPFSPTRGICGLSWRACTNALRWIATRTKFRF
jgi:hypothetical protein